LHPCFKAVKEFGEYNVEIYQLKPGTYRYDFETGNEFFQLLGSTIVEKGQLKTHVILEKVSDFFKLNFRIRGYVVLVCDKSLEEFEHRIDTVQNLIIRYGETAEEISDDQETITHNTLSINVSKYIYEYVGLEIPYKKLHPKFRDQASGGDDQLVYQTETYTKEALEDDIDPRWKELLKLKDN
jgi:uncharacterized protein